MFDVWVASSIAGSDPMKSGWTACRLAIAAFILPYFWVYFPELLLEGAYVDAIMPFVKATIGMGAIAIALSGFLFSRMNIHERVILFAGALLLLVHGTFSDIAGLILMAGIAIIKFRNRRSVQAKEVAESR